METQLTPITAKEANELVLDFSGSVFINKVYGMIRKEARCGKSEVILYHEECSFLEKNVEFCLKLRADGFKVSNNKTTNHIKISW